MVESSSPSTPQRVDSDGLRRRQVPTPASENYDDAPYSSNIIQEEEDGALSRCEVGMNESDDLGAEEGEYIEGADTDNENRDLQSLVYLKYEDNGRKQYQEKDGVTIQIWEGVALLPQKSLSFIVATDPCGDFRLTFYIALIVWCFR